MKIENTVNLLTSERLGVNDVACVTGGTKGLLDALPGQTLAGPQQIPQHDEKTSKLLNKHRIDPQLNYTVRLCVASTPFTFYGEHSPTTVAIHRIHIAALGCPPLHHIYLSSSKKHS